MGDTCITTTGTVNAADLGIVLPHEHLIYDIARHSQNPDNLCADRSLVASEVLRFKAAGGSTICDVTPQGLGRDADALAEISVAAGVRVVSALGLYQREVLPVAVRNASEDGIVEYLRRMLDAGSVGMLGELASHNAELPDWAAYRLGDHEVDLFRAAARAQRASGLALTTHASLGRAGVAQLRVLEQAGADLERVIVGHCDAHLHEEGELDHAYYQELLRFGATLEFDLFGWQELGPDVLRCRRIAELCQQGWQDRILISTDTCRLSHLAANGGRGFTYLFDVMIPGLLEAGVSKEAVDAITIHNPGRLLAVPG